jgi:transcriptional regulator with XRE-family HTH domain
MVLTDEQRKRLRKLMLIQGVSQRQLADHLGWDSHSYLGRLLRGDVRTLNTDTAARIAHFFQVGMDDLFVVKTTNDVARSTQPRRAA